MLSNHALPRGLRRLRRLVRRNESGAALVEFALVFGLFVFILYGLIAFGMMLAVKQSITNASSEGARAAIGAVPMPGDADQNAAYVRVAKETVNQRLNWLGTNYVEAEDLVVGPPVACNGSHMCLTVTVTYNYAKRPLVPPAPGLKLVTPSSFKSEATVQVA